MTIVKVSKQRLQTMRDDECEALLTEVSSFCIKHKISIPNMDEIFVAAGRVAQACPKFGCSLTIKYIYF